VVELAVGAFGQAPRSENTILFLSTTMTVRLRFLILGGVWEGQGCFFTSERVNRIAHITL
jgi:hypothetical protein